MKSRFPRASAGTFLTLLLGIAVAAACGKNESSGPDGVGNGDGDGDGDDPATGGAISGDGDGDGDADGGQGGASSGGTNMGGDNGTGGNAPCEDLIPLRKTAPDTLSETGLYSDIGLKEIAEHVREFEPKFKLWSDGAEKTRWLFLPELCGDGIIDTSDMDSWKFPVGTYAFKQFVVDGKLIETRMIHRHGPGSQDWLYATYVWNAEETEAFLDLDGEVIAREDEGPDYQVPSVAGGHCARCHGPNNPAFAEAPTGMPSRLLGINAIDLSHDGPGLTISQLSEEGSLSVLAADGFEVPGTDVERAALGYLHANCGYCHNDTPLGQPFGDKPYHLRLKTGHATVEDTDTYKTAVNQPIATYFSPEDPQCTHRIHGGDVALSCIHERMGFRLPDPYQMPPLDTNRQDEDGLAIIEAWIDSLDPPL